MGDQVVCPDCGVWHEEPAEAILGIEVRCRDCLVALEIEASLQDDYESVRAA